MAGKRKLFIMHASELANRLVHAFKNDGLVAAFVRAYADRFKRSKLVNDPERLHELESTIGREALLAVAVEVRRLAPAAFSEGVRKPGAEQMALADAFVTEFVASLGRALDWSAADVSAEAQALDRDLEMYWRWGQRSALASQPRRVAAGESPFADRCAILLDPPMMEQARRAAALFETQIVRVGARILDQLGRHPSDAGVRPSPPVLKISFEPRKRLRRQRGAKHGAAAKRTQARMVKRTGRKRAKPRDGARERRAQLHARRKKRAQPQRNKSLNQPAASPSRRAASRAAKPKKLRSKPAPRVRVAKADRAKRSVRKRPASKRPAKKTRGR
jgi:hypothetical protein